MTPIAESRFRPLVVKALAQIGAKAIQRMRPSSGRGSGRQAGFTLVEVMAATAILGFVGASIFWGLASGTEVIKATREDLRATQILLQKMEAMRLFTWSQINDPTNYLTSNFTEDYDPLGATNNNGGAKYRCFVTASTPAAGALPEAYRTNMCTLTATLYWTNYYGARTVLHRREMQTRVARNGMQNYLWGAL
jgi:prepilin-type N-terminal cleavage/methylation domain-containing protein